MDARRIVEAFVRWATVTIVLVTGGGLNGDRCLAQAGRVISIPTEAATRHR
ncbi:MAG TPA: hypothetical protein V6D08_17225 [Candidatus Obscuribacterales bacterium]